jgi:hypothetical protein
VLSIKSKRVGEDTVMRVTDGARDVWTFEPDDNWGVYGAGRDYVWVGDRKGAINIYDVAARAKSATIKIQRGKEWGSISASKDGLHLYVFQPIEQDESSTLHVINLREGRIVASHSGIPGYFQNYPIERPDGRLLLPCIKRPSVPGITIGTIDPLHGNPTAELLGNGPLSGSVIPSPDGRYLLRRDLTQLPRKTAGGAPRRLFGFGRRGADGEQMYYGLVWQVWEASPLRFVRRFVTEWMKPEELMDSFRFQHRLPVNDAITERRKIWDAISAAMTVADATPEGGLPSREHFRTSLVKDDHEWRQMKDTLDIFAATSRFERWQPDGSAFWLRTNNYLKCVGLDGSTSARLYLERVGLDPNTTPLCARRPDSFVPLDGRQAEVIPRCND